MDFLNMSMQERTEWFNKNYLIINNLDDLKSYLKTLKKRFAFDTELTGLDFSENQLIGLSLWDGEGRPAFVQFNFKGDFQVKSKQGRQTLFKDLHFEKSDAIDLEAALPYLREVFRDAELITSNGKFDYKAALKFGFLENAQIVEDTQIQAYLLEYPAEKQGLKYLANIYKIVSDLQDFQEVGKDFNWYKINWEEFGKYGARDAYLTYILHLILGKKLKEVGKGDKLVPKADLERVYREIEVPLIPVTAEMEYYGIYIDTELLQSEKAKAELELEQLKEKVFDIAGIRFNINSTQQLAEVLYDRLGLPVIKTTKKGQKSVDRETLEELAYLGYDIADLLLEYSELKKLINTYFNGLPKQIKQDGRLHAQFNQTFTRTGRFSSSNPNLQSVPANKKYDIRAAFKPRPGYVFVGGDYSQLELRVMAWLSHDRVLTQAYLHGEDIHQKTTDGINQSMGLTITRQEGKTINFSVLYGMSGATLAANINRNLKKMFHKGKITEEELKKRMLTEKQGEQIVLGFFKTYKGYAKLVRRIADNAVKRGYATTYFGRVRTIPEIRKRSTYERGKRYAVSTTIQGTAADLVKRGMWRAYRALKAAGIDFVPILQVHDEFWIEVKEEHAEKAKKIMKREMERVEAPVPFIFEADIFDSWSGLKKKQPKKLKKKDDEIWLLTLL